MRSSSMKYYFAVVLGLALLLVAGNDAQATPLRQDADDATLRIINDSEKTICYVLICPPGAEDLDDCFVGDEAIPPGESRAFDVAEGDYDVGLADCYGNFLLAEQALTIAGQYELHYAPGPDKVLLDQATAKLNDKAYADALHLFQELLTTYPESAQAAAAQYGIAACHYGMGEVEKAKQALQTVIDNYPDSEYAAQAQQNLQTLEQSPAATSVPEAASSCDALLQSGITLYRQANYRDAVQKFQEALTCYQEIDDRQGEGNSLGNLGNAYLSMEQYTTAIEYYEQALAIARDIGDRQGEGTRLGNLGLAYRSMGQYATAIEYYEQALAIARAIGDRQGEGTRLGNLGNAYGAMGQYVTAIEYYEQALALARAIGDRRGEGRHLGNLGIAYLSMGQYATAIEYYERAIAVIETLRGELGVEEFKSSFVAQYMSPYQGMIAALIKLSRIEDAFHYAQRAKARTFLDQIGNARIDPRATDNPELIEQEQALLDEIRGLEAVLSGRSSFETLDDTRGGGPHTLTNEQQTETRSRLAQAYREYEHLLARIKLTNPEYASLRAVQASTLITVQQTLPSDVTLVEYYVVSDTQTLAFVVTQGSFHTEAISVTRDSLSLATRQFYTETQTTLSGVPASLQQLYDALVAPIEPYLTSERILIAPHDVLHYVPFAALHDGEGYLIEQHALVQLPSASVLPFVLEKARHEGSGGPPLILGDPDGSLPFGRQEAQAVAELYDTTTHVGEEALEQLVWEQGPDAAILHLATHGAYNEYAPLFSRILLAAGAEEMYDGVLEVHEVYNLDLSNAALVVLSACETRLGERSAGDEIVGLNRAFIYAGTPSVLASLWNVEDAATRDLMVGFYGYLKQGYAKDEALRQAQIDVLQNSDTAHPYYWAGFVLTGDADPLGEIKRPDGLSTGTDKWLLAVLLVVGLSVGTWLWFKKQRRVNYV
jgi:CHAT domain-containing protein/TolA-binding protein